MRSHTKRLLVVWCVAATAVGFGLGSINLPRAVALWRRGVAAEAVVTKIDPANHNTVSFAFEVEGRKYESAAQGGAGKGNQPLTLLAPGSVIRVYYDPRNPSIARPGQPGATLVNESVAVALASLVFPTLITLGMHRFWKLRSASNA